MTRVVLLVSVIAVLAALLAAPAKGAGLDAEETDKESAELQLDAGELEALLQKAAAAADGLVLPYLPTIAAAGISLSLTGLRLEGLANVAITVNDIEKPHVNATLLFDSVSLLSNLYIAGGMLNNLPFTGESWANITFVNLKVNGYYERKNKVNFCPKPNSTSIRLDLDRLIVNFNELNPGPDHQDSGVLINSMFGSFGKDIIDWLTLLFNDEQTLHPIMDKLVLKLVDLITIADCNTGSNDPFYPVAVAEALDAEGILAGGRPAELDDHKVSYFDAGDEGQDDEGMAIVSDEDDEGVVDVHAVYQQLVSMVLGEVGGLQEMSQLWEKALESFPPLNWADRLE